MAMKGMAGIIAAIMILVIVALLIYSSQTTLFFEEGIKKDASIQSTIYTMKNALDAAWMYESISVDYAVYQACYDILSRGGTSKKDSYWSDVHGSTDDGTIPETDAFKQDIVTLMQRYASRYFTTTYKFMDGYIVKAPTYNSLPNAVISSVNIGPTEISLHAEGSGKLHTEKDIEEFNERLVIKKSYAEDKVYDIPCLGLFTQAINEHDKIKNAVSNETITEMGRWPLRNPVSYQASCTTDMEDRIFYDSVKNLIEENTNDMISLTELPDWYNATSRTEEILARIISRKINTTINGLNSDMPIIPSGVPYWVKITSYEIVPDVQVNVDITPNCQKEYIGTSCSYTCTLFEYRIEVESRTGFIERTNIKEYYPISKRGYPELDIMKMTIADRLVYSPN